MNEDLSRKVLDLQSRRSSMFTRLIDLVEELVLLDGELLELVEQTTEDNEGEDDMRLHAPFFIGSALAPAIKIGDMTLSLLSVEYDDEVDRDRYTFEMATPDFTETDDRMCSGVGGFDTLVEAFSTFISFLYACGESSPDGENSTLFSPQVAQWCKENMTAIEDAMCSIQDEDGNPLTHLIEE
jgi:hypothetical protein